MIGGDNNNNDYVNNGIMNNRMLMMAVGRAILPLAQTLVLLFCAAYSAIQLQHKMIQKERRSNSSSSLVSCSSLPVPSSSLFEENELLSSIVENETLMTCNDGFHIVRLYKKVGEQCLPCLIHDCYVHQLVVRKKDL